MFNCTVLPQNIAAMNALLARCTNQDMTPIKACMCLPEEEREGPRLSLPLLLQGSAYPLQSYFPFEKSSKLDYYNNICRLYPRPCEGDKLAKVHEAAMNGFIMILNRINPAMKHPFGLDGLICSADLPAPSPDILRCLHGGDCIIDAQTYHVIGTDAMVQIALTDRCARLTELLPSCGDTLKSHEHAFGYQATLNLIYTEWQLMLLLSKYTQAHLSCYDCSVRYYQQVQGAILRVSEIDETEYWPYFPPVSESDFAFELQRVGLVELTAKLRGRYSVLQPGSRGAEQDKSLLRKMQKNFKTLLLTNENPRVKLFLNLIEKELALFELLSIQKKLTNCLKEHLSIEKLVSFCTSLTEEGKDIIAPYNNLFLHRWKQFRLALLQAKNEFRTPQMFDSQELADWQTMYSAYAEVFPLQREFYKSIRMKLRELINRQGKKRSDFMSYFRLLTSDGGRGDVLPEELLEFRFEESSLPSGCIEASKTPLAAREETAVCLPPSRNHKVKRVPKVRLERPPRKSIPGKELEIFQLIDSEATEEPIACGVPLQAAVYAPPFRYARRVQRWFEIAQDAPLDQHIFPEYATSSMEHQRRIIQYHAFSSLVDFYVEELAFKTTWENRTTRQLDERYILPAEISMPGENKVRGAIVYSINRITKKCYHRWFTIKTGEEMIDKVSNRSFYESDFPELASAGPEDVPVSDINEKIIALDVDETVFRDPILGTVTIMNRRTEIKIKLFGVLPFMG